MRTRRDGVQGRAQHDGVPRVQAARAAVQVPRGRALNRHPCILAELAASWHRPAAAAASLRACFSALPQARRTDMR
jgi:hypothetical protein